MERVTEGRTFTNQVDIVNVERDFFIFYFNLYKKKIDKEGMEEKITTSMRNTSIFFLIFFQFFYLYKKKIDKEGMEEKTTTFMGNTTTSTISEAQKEM